MPTLTKSGRVVIAESIALRAVHLAWGLGDGEWNMPPNEDIVATGLMAEIGRRTASIVGFVVSDPNGSINLPSGRFSVSQTPTNQMLVETNFEFEDSQSSVIREVGVFVGTVVAAGLPAGQRYFTPDQVDSPGRLLHLENITPIFRSPAVRENFQIVVTF